MDFLKGGKSLAMLKQFDKNGDGKITEDGEKNASFTFIINIKRASLGI